MRALFQHKYPAQKEIENVHGVNARLLGKTSKLEGNSVWHSGDTEPSKAIGKSEDYYLDKTGGDVYIKENGEWVISSIVGGSTTGPLGGTSYSYFPSGW